MTGGYGSRREKQPEEDAMKCSHRLSTIVDTVAIFFLAGAIAASAAEGTISGPFAHRNLQLFLVHGEGQLSGRTYLPLSEAMDRGLVEVVETGNVQELSIHNRSKDVTVFVHAGDIVKGGRQDRTVRYDLILPPNSGKVPLASFCVEAGRWRKRGNESADLFSKNDALLPSRKLRIASKYALDQGQVWSGVADEQQRLSANVAAMGGAPADLRAEASASSLQLTLESDDLKKVMDQYLEHLLHLLNGKDDVIGLVYAINGEIANAEIYNQHALFRALWPKLVKAAVIEAIAEYDEGTDVAPLAADALPAFFRTALSGSVEDMDVWKSTRMRTYTTPDILLFETIDVAADHTWIHKNIVPREDDPIVVPIHRSMGMQSDSGQHIQLRR